MLYSFSEPEMRAFSNSSIAQIPEPNHYGIWCWSLLALEWTHIFTPQSTVFSVYSIVGLGVTGPPLSTNRSGRVLQAISSIMNNLCVKRIITFDRVHHMHSKANASHPLAAHWQINSNSLYSSTSQFLPPHFDRFMRVPSLLTIFTVSLHQQCMPLSQYQVVCIPNTFDMLTAQKWNCDARNEDFCWEKHIIPAGYC